MHCSKANHLQRSAKDYCNDSNTANEEATGSQRHLEEDNTRCVLAPGLRCFEQQHSGLQFQVHIVESWAGK